MPEPPASKPPLVVFSDDWGRHPSSCQHLIRHLLPHRAVTWVNTIGTRPPRLDRATAKRAAEKIKQWLRRPDRKGGLVHKPSLTVGPRIVSPTMWPSFRSTFARGLNRKLLLRALTPVVDALSAKPVVVTTLPLVADLVGRLPAARWVYYCVDDFSQWPGYDGETMQRMERDLVPMVDAVVAVSDTLVSHVADLGKRAGLLTHGVDLDFWRQPVPSGIPEELAGLDPPFVLFWGVVDRRTDTSFVKAVAGKLMSGTVVLIGPRDTPDPDLFLLPRVAYRPAVPLDRLPALASAAAVLIMPYIDAPVTRAIQPLKLKEYLATGKPAVVRALPSTRPWADACDVAETADVFAAKVVERMTSGLPVGQRLARQRLESEGWAEKAKLFEAWIDG
jgi:hypothetical protein